MRRIESNGAPGLTRKRLIIMYRDVGTPSKSRSCMLALEPGEIEPSLDDALEAAMNAIVRLSQQRRDYGK